MDERFVGGRVQIGVFAAVIVIPMRALPGGARAELRKLCDFRWIRYVVKSNASQTLVVFALIVEMGVVVLAHWRLRRGIRDRCLRPGH